MNRVPEIGELVTTLRGLPFKRFQVVKRTRKDNQTFVWDEAIAHRLEDVRPLPEPEVGDLVVSQVTGQVFGVVSKDDLTLVDERGGLHRTEDCDRLRGPEITQSDIGEMIESIDFAIEQQSIGDDEALTAAIAILEALAATCVTQEQKRAMWAGIRPDQREYISSTKAAIQPQQEAA